MLDSFLLTLDAV